MKEFIVGLDIGAGSLKIARFIQKEGSLYLEKADLKELRQPEDNALYEQETISALKELFREISGKKSRVIAVINCPKTAVTITKTPYMPRTELRESISLEAKNYFPFAGDGALLDYEICGDAVEEGIRKYEIAAAVSPKATVEKYLSLLRKAGIKPVSFVPAGYALWKAARQASIAGKTQCFMDMGKAHTELIICKGKSLLLSRKIPAAGDDFTGAMTEALVSDKGKTELAWDEAEQLKRATGIPDGIETRIIDDKLSASQVISMLRAPLEQLAGEIKRCFDYYREDSVGGRIDSLVLFGEGASLGGLAQYLSEQLGVDVRMGDSFEGIQVLPGAVSEKGKVSSRMELAAGAARTGGKGINLLPPELKEETKRVVKRGTLEAAAVAAVLIAAFIYTGMNIQLENFRKRIAVAEKELQSLRPQLKDIPARLFADAVSAGEPYWEDIFKELSNIVPDDIYLTELSMENRTIKMKGIAGSAEKDELLSGFIFALEKGMFSRVTLVTSRELEDKTANKFELTCGVD